MNFEEVKQRFPESANEIESLESLGFANRSKSWLDSLDLEKASTACGLIWQIGNASDADLLIHILSGERNELWMQSAAYVTRIASAEHLKPLLSILKVSSNPLQRESVAYVLSFLFLSSRPASRKIVKTLINLAADISEFPVVRAQALEGLGNQLYTNLSPKLYRLGVAAILEALNSSEAEVRFWGCFAASQTRIKEALPKLKDLMQNDQTKVSGWWTVGEEAEDAVKKMNGEELPDRIRS